MRPQILTPLFASVKSLPKIGPKLSALLAEATGRSAAMGEEARVADLLFHLPFRVIDRRKRSTIAEAQTGQFVTLEITIDGHQPPPHGRFNVPSKVLAHDDTDEITLVFFRQKGNWLERALPEGAEVLISGQMEHFNGKASIVHPDILTQDGDEPVALVEPVYPLVAGLAPKTLRNAIIAANKAVPHLPEWLEPHMQAREKMPSFAASLQQIHKPETPEDIAPETPARRRLAYDELLAGQLSLAMVRKRAINENGREMHATGQYTAAISAALPYQLTAAQQKAVAEITADLQAPDRMLRLLQGDVGSGKTIVALLAMAHAAEAGFQSAIMTPTEILSRQHYASIKPLADAAGLNIAVLTGKDTAATRRMVMEDVANGTTHIIIGTQALFQDKVIFANLGLVVIDEQHRFGVHQRLRLGDKGITPDMLVMTATPIPRTLVLTAFGDMNVSKLDEKPPGRQPIQTVTLPLDRLDGLVQRIQAAIQKGEKAYWICPLVEESEQLDVISADQRFESLKPLFGNQIGLIHGRMTSTEKEAAMAAFKASETKLLIATTVIEVGVDVPDASIMVIEHAERFGLAQLHQLRGRVGRGSAASSCILLYKAPLGETAKARLSIMRETEDGFRIAEEDLKLRGEGEVLGTRQSGLPGFKVAQMEHHADLLAMARDDARLILTQDPDLSGPRGQALRILLYLFSRDEAVRLLRAG